MLYKGSFPWNAELFRPFRGRSDASYAIAACRRVSDRRGIAPGAESFPGFFFLNLALTSFCFAGGVRGVEGRARTVSGRLMVRLCASDSSWPRCHVGKTWLCSCSRKVKAELLSGDERRFLFRVLSPSGLG